MRLSALHPLFQSKRDTRPSPEMWAKYLEALPKQYPWAVDFWTKIQGGYASPPTPTGAGLLEDESIFQIVWDSDTRHLEVDITREGEKIEWFYRYRPFPRVLAGCEEPVKVIPDEFYTRLKEFADEFSR